MIKLETEVPDIEICDANVMKRNKYSYDVSVVTSAFQFAFLFIAYNSVLV